MSDKRIAWWTTIKTTFVFWLAGLANRHLGVMVLYWTNPLEWEEYMTGRLPAGMDLPTSDDDNE